MSPEFTPNPRKGEWAMTKPNAVCTVAHPSVVTVVVVVVAKMSGIVSLALICGHARIGCDFVIRQTTCVCMYLCFCFCSARETRARKCRRGKKGKEGVHDARNLSYRSGFRIMLQWRAPVEASGKDQGPNKWRS